MQLYTFPIVFIVFFVHFSLVTEAVNTETADQAAVHDSFNGNVSAGPSESAHTNNWAVLVCASRYWFNYRVRLIGPLHASFPLKSL